MPLIGLQKTSFAILMHLQICVSLFLSSANTKLKLNFCTCSNLTSPICSITPQDTSFADNHSYQSFILAFYYYYLVWEFFHFFFFLVYRHHKCYYCFSAFWLRSKPGISSFHLRWERVTSPRDPNSVAAPSSLHQEKQGWCNINTSLTEVVKLGKFSLVYMYTYGHPNIKKTLSQPTFDGGDQVNKISVICASYFKIMVSQ